jgi:uncharacterized protein YdiU (UPF0061 family)
VVGGADELQGVLEACARDLEQQYPRMLHAKLGIAVESEHDALVEELPALLQRGETDMTIFFRRLAELPAAREKGARTGGGDLPAPLVDAYYAPERLTADDRAALAAWVGRYTARLERVGLPHVVRRDRMNAVNPKLVLRNYLAQLAIDKAEQGDASLVDELLVVLRMPYADQPEREALAAKRPEWARHRPGCSMLSCSS